jgi:hypothetical protein
MAGGNFVDENGENAMDIGLRKALSGSRLLI